MLDINGEVTLKDIKSIIDSHAEEIGWFKATYDEDGDLRWKIYEGEEDEEDVVAQLSILELEEDVRLLSVIVALSDDEVTLEDINALNSNANLVAAYLTQDDDGENIIVVRSELFLASDMSAQAIFGFLVMTMDGVAEMLAGDSDDEDEDEDEE